MPSKWHDINEPSGLGRNNLKASKPEQVVEIAPAAAPAAEKKPEIRLLKGIWLAGENGFEFNKKCKARIEAKFLKETSAKKITVETFVHYRSCEEDLSQSIDVALNNDGIGEFEPTLFYGQAYKQAQNEDNADPECQYIFKASAKNCLNEIESELLEMPFLPDCLKEQQKKQAEANKSSSETGSAACSGDCEQCEKKPECFPGGEQCEFYDECKIRDNCTENPPAQQEEPQESAACMNTTAARTGNPATMDCATCEKKEECGI